MTRLHVVNKGRGGSRRSYEHRAHTALLVGLAMERCTTTISAIEALGWGDYTHVLYLLIAVFGRFITKWATLDLIVLINVMYSPGTQLVHVSGGAVVMSSPVLCSLGWRQSCWSSTQSYNVIQHQHCFWGLFWGGGHNVKAGISMFCTILQYEL